MLANPETPSNDDLIVQKYFLPVLDNVTVAKKMYIVNTLADSYFVRWYQGGPNTRKVYVLKNGSTFVINTSGATMLSIDINGISKPNILGKDVFVFYLNKNKNRLLPLGYGLSRDALKSIGPDACKRDGNWGNAHYGGVYCAALIIQDGWKISEDYPW